MKIAIACLFIILQVLLHEAAGAGKFKGVNHSGTEYTCLRGNGVFEGPTDQNAVNAMKTWRINMVRIPLNSDCWLGNRNDYKNQITAYVNLLLKNGISVVLTLMWSNGANTSKLPTTGFCTEPAANCLKPMPDATFAPVFWLQVARWFKYNNNIHFDLFNEPYPDRVSLVPRSSDQVWKCWRNGGNACFWITYKCTGMQQLVSVIRYTGATNPIMISGVNFANDMTGWLANVPYDRLNNIIASFHVYRNNYFNRVAQFGGTITAIQRSHQVIVAEFGQGDCKFDWVYALMRWLDGVGISYLAWTWNLWGCQVNNGLISDWNGTPTGYGAGIRSHYLTGR